MNLERWVALAIGLSLLGLAVWTARSSRQRGDGVVTALGAFSLVWGISLVLFAMPLIRYTTTPVGVWLMIYGSIATFAVGALLAERRYRDLPHIEPDERQRPNDRRLRLMWLLFAVLGLFGFVAFAYAVDAAVGWQAMLNDQQAVRVAQTNSQVFADNYGPWTLLSYCNQIAFLLWTLAVRERSFHGIWRVAWFLGPVSLVPFILSGERTLIAISLVWAAAFLLLYNPPVRIRRFAFAAVAGLVTVLVVFTVIGARLEKTIDSHPEIAEHLTTRSFDSVVFPYLYLTGSPPTLAGLIDDPIRPDTNGKFLLLPAFKVLYQLGLTGEHPPDSVQSYYPIPFETYNANSWLGLIYSDFGVVGIILVPLLLGFICTLFVIRAVRRRTLLSVWIASLLLYCIAYTTFAFKFSDTIVWQYILAGILIVPLIRQDLGPRKLVGQLQVWAGAHRRVTLAASAMAVGILALVIVGFLSRQAVNPLPESRRAKIEKLRDVAELAALTRVGGDFPISSALASRLHAVDPGVIYVFLSTPDATATDAQTIGVYSAGDRLILKASNANEIVELDTSSGREKISFLKRGTAPVDEELVFNGGFEQGFGQWSIAPGEVAKALIFEPGFESLRSAEVSGTGKSGTNLFVRQTINLSAPDSACFRFSASTRTRNLSRNMLVWANFFAADDTSSLQLIIGDKQAGLESGNSPWQRSTVEGTLAEPIVAIAVFAADTGDSSLSGKAWIDDISLRRTC